MIGMASLYCWHPAWEGKKAARCISILKQECSLFMDRQVFFWSWRKNCKESFRMKRKLQIAYQRCIAEMVEQYWIRPWQSPHESVQIRLLK